MKIKKSFIIIFLLILLILVACEKEEALGTQTIIDDSINETDFDEIDNYNINVDLNYEEKAMEVEQITTYINKEGRGLDETYFHLYPNAFKTAENAPTLFDAKQIKGAYKEGYIDIEKISIKGKDADYKIDENLNTILKIDLDKTLKPGAKIDISFKYKVVFPSSKERFGYGNRTINSGNWYPIACVYDENGWNLDPYYKVGDPFYSDINNYNVEITTDENVIIASSGNQISNEIEDDKKTYKIEGKLIRDFAFVASKDFNIEETKVDGTTIKLYYLDYNREMIKKALEITSNSIKTFNDKFGKYPYGVYSVVMTEFPSGMEYPGIVFISEDSFRFKLVDILEQFIVHETAHQWWYGLVGSNQIKEAWLDEGLTTYSETIYQEEVYGRKKGKEYFRQNILMGYDHSKMYLTEDRVVNKPLDEFSDWNDYGILVYTQGAMFVDRLRNEVGEAHFDKILKTYFNEFKYKNARTEDFINIAKEISGLNLEELVDKWLFDNH